MSKKLLNVISIVIPIVVGVLLGLPDKFYLGEWTKGLPFVNAIFNSLTAVFLILALISIKNKNIKLHQSFIYVAVLLGLGFLINSPIMV